MLADLLTLAVAVVTALLVGFVARRILDARVGWPRSIIVGGLIVFGGVPFASWVLDESALEEPARTDPGAALLALVVVAIAFAWVFAAGVAVLVASEALFPTRPPVNPIDFVRSAVRRWRRNRRYLQILTIASRHGTGWLLHGRGRAEHEVSTSAQRAQSLIAAINESGVTFVKLGQVLSTRRDLVPEPYLTALGALQTSAAELPWEVVHQVIVEELGAPLSTVYADVDPIPLAAASVAQVHGAYLLDGTPVVVKVQRPAARAQVEADVDIVLRLAERAERGTQVGRDLRLESVARGFTVSLLEELDYRVEASNTRMLQRSLKLIAAHSDSRTPAVTVPAVHAKGSTRRMLTLDLVEGVPLSRAGRQLAALSTDERDLLATTLMSAVIEQILVHGVFHADLHPGNVMLRPDGSLSLIDFGAVGVIERSQREHLTLLLLAALGDDDVTAADALLAIVDMPADADRDGFRHDIGVVLTTEKFGGGSASIFSRMVDVIRQHRVALPADLAAAFRSFATLEGCLRSIVPDYDMVQRALPMIPGMIRRELSVRRLSEQLPAQAVLTARVVRDFPRRLDSVLTGVAQGTAAGRIASAAVGDGSLRTAVSEFVATAASLVAVVLAVVLVVSGGGPVLAGNVGLFSLLGSVIGFFGFLGLLRIVRQTAVRRGR